MALLSLDPLHLKVLQKCGTSSEQAAAANVLPLVKRHQQMLVTLLLTAAICAEALPLFLDRLTDVWVAIALSVSLILIFRELIPHALSSKVRVSNVTLRALVRRFSNSMDCLSDRI
jgi:CBS domain containing-hemolysin-like protein